MRRMMKDLTVDRERNPQAFVGDRWEQDDEEEEDDEGEIIDRSEEKWPTEYIDVTRAQRHPSEDIRWPRPG